MHQSIDQTDNLGKQITSLSQVYKGISNVEGKYKRKETVYKKDLADLLEYVRWISEETGILRGRVRAAEQVISQLRQSGETSVESLLDTLYVLRKKQTKLDQEAEMLRI